MNKMHESNHTKWNAILGDYDLAGPDCITELKPDTAWHIDHPSGHWVIAKRPMYDPGSRRVERLEAASGVAPNRVVDADELEWVIGGGQHALEPRKLGCAEHPILHERDVVHRR